MSTWTTPITWASAAVTVGQANTEWRDHLNFLKGALDLITNSTTADTGTATQLRIVRASGASTALDALVSGDTQYRWKVNAAGTMVFGSGTVADVAFFRSDPGEMRVSANGTANTATLYVMGTSGQRAAVAVRVDPDTASRAVLWGDATLTGVEFGPGGGTARDTLLKRSAANELELASSPATLLIGTGSATSTRKFAARVSGDGDLRFAIRADGQLQWGSGSVAVDTSLTRTAADTLRTDDHFIALDGLQTKAVAGVVSDASFTVTPASGTIAIDTTNSRIYVRVGSTWKMVAVA